LPSSHPISLKLPSMGVFDTDWEWPASPAAVGAFKRVCWFGNRLL